MAYSNESLFEDTLISEYLRRSAKIKTQGSRKKKETILSLEEERSAAGDKEFPGFDPYYSKYEDDPVGFIRHELGEEITEDIKRLVSSIMQFQVTHGRSANAVGKTHAIARIAVWWYMCRRGAKVFTAAAPPEDNLKELLWSEIGAVVERNKRLFKGHRVTSLHISRNKQEYITGVTIPVSGTVDQRKARFSGKHAPNLLFILDEGDAIPAEIYEAIDSCMSGGFSRLCVTYNPRAPQGPVYNKELIGAANVVQISAFTHPNVVEGTENIPGAVTRDKTVLRMARWTRPLFEGEDETASDVYRVPDFLVGARAIDEKGHLTEPLKPGLRKVIEPAFFYMVLAQYPPTGANQLIQEDWIQAARSRWEAYVSDNGTNPPAGVRPLLGHDVASEGEDWNCVCLRYGGFVPPIRKWKGVDARTSGDKGAQIGVLTGATHSFIDATGVGAGAYGAYRIKNLPYTPVHSMGSPTKRTDVGQFYRMRDQILWQVREWLRDDPSATLPPSELLLEELRVLSYETSQVDGKIHILSAEEIKTILGRSPDELMSLAYTFATPKARSKNRGSVVIVRR